VCANSHDEDFVKLGDAVRVVPAAARRRDGATATRAMPKVTKRTERDARELVDASGAIVADDADALRPVYAPLGAPTETRKGATHEYRKVNVPAHRFAPLREHWMALYEPVTKQMKIDVRMNLKLKKVELKTTERTEDESALQKSADFVQAFLLGFDVQDAVALLRLDDLYLECFEVKDVKTLRGEHMSRGIGRLAGKNGKTKFTIENATRTRIVIADQHIRILGSFQNIKVARDAICSLILGSPPGKVYSRLRAVTARLAERF
jgi:RNA-binding protein PNO1